MRITSAAEWRTLLMRLHKHRRDPFDGRKADFLLAVGLYMSTTVPRGKGSRVALKATREVFGDRVTRRYVSVFVGSELLVMVVRPTRATAGRDGRVAIYEFRDPTESLPTSTLKAGSESYDQSGQRLCSDEDSDPEADRARSLPTSTLKATRLSTSATLLDLLVHFVAVSA